MTDLAARLEAAEIQIAHLSRTVEELSDVVAAQADRLDALTRRTRAMLEREAEREAQGGHAPPADQKPPHW
jgi:SlyX protein